MLPASSEEGTYGGQRWALVKWGSAPTVPTSGLGVPLGQNVEASVFASSQAESHAPCPSIQGPEEQESPRTVPPGPPRAGSLGRTRVFTRHTGHLPPPTLSALLSHCSKERGCCGCRPVCPAAQEGLGAPEEPAPLKPLAHPWEQAVWPSERGRRLWEEPGLFREQALRGVELSPPLVSSGSSHPPLLPLL